VGSTLQAGIGLAIVGVLLAAAAVTVSMAHQAAPAAAPASPMADFQPREPARAPTEQPMRAA